MSQPKSNIEPFKPTRITITATGYYNSTEKRLVLLHKGDVLDAKPVDMSDGEGWYKMGKPGEIWYQATLPSGRIAFVDPDHCETPAS